MSSGESTSHPVLQEAPLVPLQKEPLPRVISQLTSLLQSLCGEVAESHSGLREELEKISSRVMEIEQGSTEPTSQEQSLPTVLLQTAALEQSSNTLPEQNLNPCPLGQDPPQQPGLS